MNEMTTEDKLFALIAHADDLQKIADASLKDLQAATVAVKDMAKVLPLEASGAVSSAVSEIVSSRLIGPVKQAGADFARATEAVKATTKGLWLYPVVIVATIMVVLSGYTYFGVQWVMDERDRVLEELAALNHELAKTANVRKFTTEDGEDQFWVEIDPTKKTGDANGKTWARMPRR